MEGEKVEVSDEYIQLVKSILVGVINDDVKHTLHIVNDENEKTINIMISIDYEELNQ